MMMKKLQLVILTLGGVTKSWTLMQKVGVATGRVGGAKEIMKEKVGGATKTVRDGEKLEDLDRGAEMEACMMKPEVKKKPKPPKPPPKPPVQSSLLDKPVPVQRPTQVQIQAPTQVQIQAPTQVLRPVPVQRKTPVVPSNPTVSVIGNVQTKQKPTESPAIHLRQTQQDLKSPEQFIQRRREQSTDAQSSSAENPKDESDFKQSIPLLPRENSKTTIERNLEERVKERSTPIVAQVKDVTMTEADLTEWFIYIDRQMFFQSASHSNPSSLSDSSSPGAAQKHLASQPPTTTKRSLTCMLLVVPSSDWQNVFEHCSGGNFSSETRAEVLAAEFLSLRQMTRAWAGPTAGPHETGAEH
ncbi:hypothetical protein WMY93_000718 [Mugilogobius chulae]|uniref:Uncharacterized protein n=1 Tax=Mugilogobius chulae TaxID=88201 RepID=A0AAW0QA48_9GOBI